MVSTIITIYIQANATNKVIELNKNNANRTSNLQLTLDNIEQSSFNKSLNCFLLFLNHKLQNDNIYKV